VGIEGQGAGQVQPIETAHAAFGKLGRCSEDLFVEGHDVEHAGRFAGVDRPASIRRLERGASIDARAVLGSGTSGRSASHAVSSAL
jgi:hypothetical protein